MFHWLFLQRAVFHPFVCFHSAMMDILTPDRFI